MDSITNKEFDDVLTSLPVGKSPGPSRIPNEMWKKAPSVIKEMLHTLINECIQQQDTPTEWKRATIVLIPKKETWSGTLEIPDPSH